MVLIPEITSAVLSKSDIKLASKDFNSGHVETINASSGLLCYYLPDFSVKNGINGCNT
jgi:hypothetical protein